jgi:hypothetical protein
MNLCRNTTRYSTRRDFLQRTSAGFGWLAFSALAAQRSRADGPAASGYINPLAPKPPHFPAKAKRVIFLYMQGGPSHLETFDWKPELAKVEPSTHKSALLAPVIDFKPRGKSGIMISDAFPELSKHADDLCLLNGCWTNNPGHAQATVALHTGNERFVRPSMGAWTVYGLGSEAQDLPGFVTLNPIHDNGGAMNYGSAFLPASYQGTPLGTGSPGVPNIENGHLHEGDQRRQLDLIQSMNKHLQAHDAENPEIAGVISSYELAYQMQMSVPGVLDISKEPDHVRELYGADDSGTANFGTQCLLARRLAEKGVRFIQLTSVGWDHHNHLREGVADRAAGIDKPIAGLIADLKQRDMLKDTLIVWGGEFGRGAHDDKGDGNGRGHQAKGFSMWMAGGGVKGGMRYGATNELGQEAVSGKMGTHDLHATMLYLLGLDHERLTYKYAGRDFRLTDVAGEVAKDIVA